MLEDGTNATESNWRSRFEQLPIGSVVTLEGGTKKLMIYGRLQRKEEGEKVWDYLACPWPEGNLDPDHSYLFDAIDVERVYFLLVSLVLMRLNILINFMQYLLQIKLPRRGLATDYW